MAAAVGNPRNQVRCRYFLHGACKLQSECPFSHSIQDKPSMVCTFYLKGECTYGKQCRYDHVKPTYTEKEKNENLAPKALRTTKVHKPVQLPLIADSWNINAPVFQPGQKVHETFGTKAETKTQGDSYQDAVSTNLTSTHSESVDNLTAQEISQLMCPFAAVRDCPYGEECHYVHGLRCDICELECLNPLDAEQQTEHRKACLESHERNMEYSFAIQRSEGVTCSICLDVVTERQNPTEKRFGILENCNHSFCLSCIRKWRQSGGSKVVKACPICRTNSGFVTPSEIWIENPDEKSKLIADYHDALSLKECRYFDKGNGNCPFGTSCFYKHVYADGNLESRDKPKIRFCADSDGNTQSVRDQRLWDFIEERDMRSYED